MHADNSSAPVFQALADYVQENAESIAQNGVRLSALAPMQSKALKTARVIVGCHATQSLGEALEQASQLSISQETLRVTLAVDYSGRADLVSAIRRLCDAATLGDLVPSQIGPQELARSLCLRGLPPVDLLVRTGGETALSDFLLWQSAYTELLFLETPWSEFRHDDFSKAMADYAKRKRTFGALPTN
jgi:undecaprenyl diphosphate synthase